MSTNLSETQATVSASQRIINSRERLREALGSGSAGRSGYASESASARQHGSADTAGGDLLSGVQAVLNSIPGASFLIGSIASWWAQHPLHTTGLLAAGAAKAVVKPRADRHPLTLMLSMVFIGGILVWKRPWRLLFTPALFVGLIPHLISRFVQERPLVEGSLRLAVEPWPRFPHPPS